MNKRRRKRRSIFERGSVGFVVKPAAAARLLDCGLTRLYSLIAQGELLAFKDGRSTKLMVEGPGSIQAYIARKKAQAEKAV
jgi:hypothetical protein